MGTMDHMIIDNKDLANKYFSNSTFDEFSDEFRYEKRGQKSNNNSNNNYLTVNKDDGSYAQNGRRVYLESPSLAKEEEDMYRYVPSRLSEVPPATETGENLIDSLDFELDLMGANNNVQIPMQYRTKTQVPKQPDLLTQFPSTLTRSPTSRRPNPRQDPLLGPLLAELDALSSQQQSIYKNPQVYENSLNNGFQSTFSTTQTRGLY
ncbi:unnamed protein product [Didymodactylos carnosus]|uniref:Uncharacterized protein n=1 Tax=Didymodactylos carnosus TaxID=1234261 RepID=A0A8S2E4L7_9BILA|nr:unnamed protein product [Didymodactylos carnosus]CAF3831859.1 unnamed protein product [Didymodactylos carnosus]